MILITDLNGPNLMKLTYSWSVVTGVPLLRRWLWNVSSRWRRLGRISGRGRRLNRVSRGSRWLGCITSRLSRDCWGDHDVVRRSSCCSRSSSRLRRICNCLALCGDKIIAGSQSRATTWFATANLNGSAAAIFPVPEKSNNKIYCHTVTFRSCFKF